MMFNRNYEEPMKSKMLVILSTVVMALGLMAQNATQTPTAPSGDSSKACVCCNHDQADGKMACCGKDGKCGQMSKDGKDAAMSHDEMMSKDGKSGMKCPMMAKGDGKDGKMSCCCKDGKCDMAKGSKGCCGGKMCERSTAGV
jgi:hypothetical protein